MANPFKNALDKAEAHPAIAAMIFGTIILVITLIVMKRNSSSTAQVVNPATGIPTSVNSAGQPIDPNTGLPLTNNGGFTLTPTNNNSDVLSAIGQLGQSIQNLVASQNQTVPTSANNNSDVLTAITNLGQSITTAIKNAIPTSNPPSNPTPTNTNPPPVNNPSPTPTPQPVVNAPAPIPQLRQVSVVQWTNRNTPWNSTLSGIASHFGESLAYIERINPQIRNPNLIYPGQKVNY